jgi:hypothetical protein
MASPQKFSWGRRPCRPCPAGTEACPTKKKGFLSVVYLCNNTQCNTYILIIAKVCGDWFKPFALRRTLPHFPMQGDILIVDRDIE